MKNIKLSRGEICVANFIPPVNGVSQSNYFLSKSYKLAVFEAKMSLQKQLWQPKLPVFVSVFFLSSRVKVGHFKRKVGGGGI